MKRWISCILCVVLLSMSMPFTAVADSSYSTVSSKNVELEYPTEEYYLAIPMSAIIKATKTNGSIYFMPTPKDGNGVLGTVANGTQVTILAEKSGYYFFSTMDGRVGWNGKKYFADLQSLNVTTLGNGTTFFFDSGASIVLPSGFVSTYTERDRNNAYINSYYTNYDQNMDLILTEIDTYMYYQRDTDFMNNLYKSLKEDYPAPTYDTNKSNMFALSGYAGDNIYYFQGILSNQVVYLMKMFYPTRNRIVCDAYVEEITGSFSGVSGISFSVGEQSSPTILNIPANPISPYGIALRDNLVYGVSYTDWQKKDIVNETYYGRKDEKGERQPWYTSATYDDPNTGYQIGFYYADGMVFFADAYHVGQRSSVTFYFWGNQMLCCHDLRNGDKQLRFAGSDTYSAIVSEFGDLYSIALSLR